MDQNKIELKSARLLPVSLAINHSDVVAISKHAEIPNRNLYCIDFVSAYPRKMTAYMDRESAEYKKNKNLVYKNLAYLISKGILVRFMDKKDSVRDMNIIDDDLHRLYIDFVSAHPLGDQAI